MRQRLSILLVLFLVAVTHARSGGSSISYWEARGDSHMRAGRAEEALEAYQTALGSAPEDSRLLSKYERAYMRSFRRRGGSVRPNYGLTRMGVPRQPTPTSEPTTATSPGAHQEAADPTAEGANPPEAGEESSGETDEAASGEGSDGGAEQERGGVRVREDGVVEFDFRSMLRPISRVRPREGADRRARSTGDGDAEESGEEEEDPGPAVYGSAETVQLGEVRKGFEGSRGDDVATEDVVIRSAKYDISGVRVSYDRLGDLHITGEIVNTSSRMVRNPRVYCRIFDEAGVLRGRTFSYVKPGRNSLPEGKAKSFDVHFRGYREPVASYRFEVIP